MKKVGLLIICLCTLAIAAMGASVREVKTEQPRQSPRDLGKPLAVRGVDLAHLRPGQLGWGSSNTAYPDKCAVNSTDASVMVWVPAGDFPMGAEDVSTNVGLDSYPPDVKPVHQVTITRGFWIGRHEVTNKQYVRFLNEYGSNEDEAGHQLVRVLGAGGWGIKPEGDQYVVMPGRERHPVVAVTWYGAQAYAKFYGMKMPTEAIWEYAARGPQGNRYPWGAAWSRVKCCNPFNRGTGSPPTLEVGSIPEGASWCGARDMAGNVREWCADWYAPDYYSSSTPVNPLGPSAGEERVLRDRHYSGHETQYPWRSALRGHGMPEANVSWIGFRVVIYPTERPGRQVPREQIDRP